MQPPIPTPQVSDTIHASCSQQSMPSTSPMDAFEFMAVDSENGASNGASSYWKKKVNRSEKWEKIHKELLVVHTDCMLLQIKSQCICCGFSLPTIRCLDCGSQALFCEKDFLERHKNAVFHSPEIWNGRCFVPYAANLPVLVHYNHKIPNCVKRTREITVIGMRGGPQLFKIEFCSCESDTITLLRHRLWGSSPEIPSVAFKLDVMEWLRALVLECQVSVKGFVNALAIRLSKIENMSSKKVNGVYQALITDAFTMYMRHKYQLQQLQHIDPDLDDGTECPACHVIKEDIDINAKDLAVGGSQLVLSENSKIFSFDANFGLVRKKSSGKSPGEPFHRGRYFLDQTEVDAFVSNYVCHSKKGAGDCSDFQAGSNRSKSRTEKLDETAVFGCACSRHEFPHRFFSLKHGERLGYAVYLMEKLLQEHPHKISIMYDIACVLSAHLKKTNREERAASRVQFSCLFSTALVIRWHVS
ncbi:uncharacterized protein LOC112575228 isoform X1 [Pomacea canaliculata]|uniref:uncharacterized protein LOC112575228 isoform X1 n=1 Tax=Pomacea canaliculata TaxID=400727 RepID=UPI000D734525|nr:uncharacterized protein LOC112575228 isoform X1 [Pomacea canaliculata]XP_025112709.1 uncharacterized protein LOC112575228 isoform X1 [Pomacea canaliculata]XP_025112710.1 uncharacterized protein LOC112575228 isoform X1 [Pomacea canaliculata]XP_025112711.1 uncharacterized protein LOC112575228 isoform X1 [Pomacea canaliculata]